MWRLFGLFLLNLHNNKSCFSDSKNKQNIKGLESLTIWPQRAFLSCFFIASLSKTNIFCLSAFAHTFLSKWNELAPSYLSSTQPSEENANTPTPPAPPMKCFSISQQKSFLLPLHGQPALTVSSGIIGQPSLPHLPTKLDTSTGSEHVSLTWSYFSKWFCL